MAWFEDLTVYSYGGSASPADGHLLNVGWLAPDQPFPTGPTSAEFREALVRITLDQARNPFPDGVLRPYFKERLYALCLPRYGARAVYGLKEGAGACAQEAAPQFLQKTYGRHGCFRCQDDFEFPHEMIQLVHGDVSLSLGSGELRVRGEDGVVYAAPELITHYVLEHDYRPPDAFVRAVESSEAQQTTILVEPLSGGEPDPTAPLPPVPASLRLVWKKHSDLPPSEVPEAITPQPPPPKRGFLAALRGLFS